MVWYGFGFELRNDLHRFHSPGDEVFANSEVHGLWRKWDETGVEWNGTLCEVSCKRVLKQKREEFGKNDVGGFCLSILVNA